MDQFDAAWKLLAGNHPEAFLRLFAPDFAAAVDWGRQYCHPGHELAPPSADSASGVRNPDILLLVTLHDASPACLHIEVQCSRDESFASRMAIYRSRLHDRFALPVYSLALLADPGLRWRPDSYQEEHGGTGITVQFRAVKLMDFRHRLDEFAASRNVASFAAAIHLRALQTRRSSERRHAAKSRLLQQLYSGDWNVRELSDLRQIIDLMMPIPRKWQKETAMDIYELIEADQHADQDSFAYIMWELTDRRGFMRGQKEGLAEGIAEGIAEGVAEAQEAARLRQAALANKMLAARFNGLPAAIGQAVDQASQEQLERLALALVNAASWEDALAAAGLST